MTEGLVFTNGCFDILHAGHVDYLRKARALGNKLIVGLNTDASVQRLKGPDRPLNSELDRKFVLEALRCVDEVIFFDTPTPIELIKRLCPQYLVKGGDYTVDKVVGAQLVSSYGGQVELIKFLEGRSTTGLINKILGQSQ